MLFHAKTFILSLLINQAQKWAFIHIPKTGGTSITNVSSAQTKKIKEVRDISQKSSYTGSYGSTTGTWNDYFTNASTDPTGSYLTTYISTIGLYDNDGDMVAVAKLPTPIKNLPDYDVNFIVRFDT